MALFWTGNQSYEGRLSAMCLALPRFGRGEPVVFLKGRDKSRIQRMHGGDFEVMLSEK